MTCVAICAVLSQKQRYRIRNWRDYNRALAQLGSLTLGAIQGWSTGRGLWMCAACGHQFSLTVGTIFQDTRTPVSLCPRDLVDDQPEERHRHVKRGVFPPSVASG